MTMNLTDADRAAWATYESANARAKQAYLVTPNVTRANAVRAGDWLERGTCRRGHSLEDAYIRSNGRPDCRTCRQRRYRTKAISQ